MGDREPCRDCDFKIRALDQRIDQRIVDMEKRLDERYINQKDYNQQHNNLQREMKDQERHSASKEAVDKEFGQVVERIVKLERMSWLAGIIGGFVGAVVVGAVLALLSRLLR